MDKHIPCFCGKERLNPEDATLVLNGIPCCNEDCLRKAERISREKKTRQRGWDVVV